MARAQGARALMALAFETTYGTPPASGFSRMPFASTSLGAEQPLLNSELLGYGRDPLAPIKDAVTADGDVVVPLDAEAFGFWLKAAFGAPTTTGVEAPYTHEFQSGSWTLPSMSIETGMPEVPRYAMYSGSVREMNAPHRILVFTPSHALAEETAGAWAELGASVAVLRGYERAHPLDGRPMCRDVEIVKAAIAAGLDPQGTVCAGKDGS